jgi:hypothetical protein
MRAQKLLRVVDALATQNRVILWLECDHKVTVTAQDLVREGWNVQRIKDQPWAMCPFCPDPPPEVKQAAKSANQLWKEAGEP